MAALRPADDGYLVETSAETLSATNVVVASGSFQQPRPRVSGVDSAPVELQLTTSEYRRPGQLPEGAVLVVGGGQSGCQISDELLGAGRSVYLSAGNCAWFPRRHRGHDWVHWVHDSRNPRRHRRLAPRPGCAARVQSAHLGQRRRPRLPPALARSARRRRRRPTRRRTRRRGSLRAAGSRRRSRPAISSRTR